MYRQIGEVTVLKFRNLGLLATNLNLTPSNFRGGFLQSPQTLEIDDFLRVYFSTRFIDSSGNPISRIEFIDFSKDWERIDAFSKPLIISDPILGAYDEHGIFPFVPFRISNSEILGFISGWSRRISVDVETAIGICKSVDNGKTFTRIGDGPILAAGTGEPFLVGDPSIIRHAGILLMYYIFGTSWIQNPNEPLSPLDRVYRIGLATSRDGLNWIRNNGKQIISVEEKLECQALPSVVRYQEGWLMAFCFRNAYDFRRVKEKGYRLGFATSRDGYTWTRLSNNEYNFEISDWNSEMQCYPNLYLRDEQIFLLSNGNQFGRDGFGLHLLDCDLKYAI